MPRLFSPAFQRDPYLTHVWLGSTLARLEGRVSIRAVIRRFPNLRLADDTPDWGTNFAFRGLKTLRVRH
jgi:pimeloyl-[acyl-carrier protein] synthase